MPTPPMGMPQPMAPAEILLRTGAARVLDNASGVTIPYGAACVLGGLGGLYPSLADAAAGSAADALARCICIHPGGVADGTAGLFRFAPGLVPDIAYITATPGATAFVSGAVAGRVADAPPSAGQYAHRVGWWYASSILMWSPDLALPFPVE